ncbi:TonB-dependent siderophore receptor [Sphingobacterium spiritivorum]|uniref:TonB-dependent siderophore receptor n=1 Tax=Sphingobacterium spiritivorum TaxID=258 RepID=UPI003DA5A71B
MRSVFIILLCCALPLIGVAQKQERVRGKIMLTDQVPVKDALLRLLNTSYQSRTDKTGEFYLDNVPPGDYVIQVTLNDIEVLRENIQITTGMAELPTIYATKKYHDLDGVTVYGYRRNKFLDKDSTTAAKMPLRYLENPQALTSVNQQILKEQLITDLSDALRNVPGMVKMQGSPGRGSGDGSFYYSLRGFPTKVSMVDGVPATTNGEIDPADIERVTVLKGPSGTLYGGAVTSFGGLVNIMTKKPKDYFGGQVSYFLGSYNLNRLTADVYGPVTKSRKTLFRFNSAYQYQNGFRDSEFRKSFFAAPTFSYEVNDKLTFNLGAQLYNYEGTNTPIIFFARTRPFYAHTPDELGFDWKRSYSNNDMTLKAPSINIKGEVNYKISDNWTSQTLLSRNFRKTEGLYQYQFIRGNDSDALLERNVQWNNSEGSSTSVQQNFNGTFHIGSIKNKVLIGLDYLNQSTRNNHSPIVKYDTINGRDLENDYGFISRELATASIQKSKSPMVRNYTSSNIYGAYLSDVVYLTDRWTTLLSLRVDHYNSRGQLNLNNNVRTGEFKQTAWSPKVGMVYQVLKDRLSAYANYMNGFSYVAPVTQQLPEYNGNLKPQMANQWEAGVKTNLWENRFNLTASYYDITVNNMSRDIAVEQGGKEYLITIQDGEQRSKGLEFELITNPIAGLNIMTGYTYNDSKFQKADASVEGRRPGSAGPAHVFNSWASYVLQTRVLHGLGFGFGVNRVGEQISEDKVVTGRFTFPAYTLINASVSLEKEKYRFGFKMNNLGNAQYFAGQGVVVAQMPRNFTAELTLKF